jgi:hypothetical protein
VDRINTILFTLYQQCSTQEIESTMDSNGYNVFPNLTPLGAINKVILAHVDKNQR